MSESKKHQKLKMFAKKILLENGFSEEEIFTEHQVLSAGTILYSEDGKPELQVKRGIIADVVGIKKLPLNWKTVAIECGSTPTERITQLMLFFDEVYHIPFITTPEELSILNQVRQQKSELEHENEKLRKENQTLKQNIKETQNDLSKIMGKNQQVLI